MEKYVGNVKAVSVECLNRAVERFLDPHNLVIVLVSKVEDILKDANTLGKIKLKVL